MGAVRSWDAHPEGVDVNGFLKTGRLPVLSERLRCQVSILVCCIVEILLSRRCAQSYDGGSG